MTTKLAKITKETAAVILRLLPDGTFNSEQLQMLHQNYCSGLTPAEFGHFLLIAHHSGMDPFLGEIYPLVFDATKSSRSVVPHTSIGALRGKALSSGQCEAILGPIWVNSKGEESMYWTEKGAPFACRYEIRRTGMTSAISEPVYMRERSRGNSQWKNNPLTMLSKCALAHVIKIAFADRLKNIQVEGDYERPEPEVEVGEPLAALVPSFSTNMPPDAGTYEVSTAGEYDKLKSETVTTVVDERVLQLQRRWVELLKEVHGEHWDLARDEALGSQAFIECSSVLQMKLFERAQVDLARKLSIVADVRFDEQAFVGSPPPDRASYLDDLRKQVPV